METMNSMQRSRAAVGAPRDTRATGIFGDMSERAAQVLAVLITLGVMGGVSVALNALFTALSGA